MSNRGEVYTADLLIAFEDIAKAVGAELHSQLIAGLALALADHKDVLIPWLQAQ